MATKKPTELKVTTEEEQLDQEISKTAAALQKKADQIADKDAEIAKLKEQLEIARRESAGYRSGNDLQRVEAAIQKAIEDGVSPWEVKISVRSPIRTDTNEKSYWLCINSQSCQVPADDRYHDLKLPFASALVNMIQAEEFARNYADNEIKAYDPIMNPHPVN